jgi:hypothetical protein
MVDNVVGNSRKPDYKDMMQSLLEHCKNLGYSVSIKLNSIHTQTTFRRTSVVLALNIMKDFTRTRGKWTRDLKMDRL